MNVFVHLPLKASNVVVTVIGGQDEQVQSRKREKNECMIGGYMLLVDLCVLDNFNMNVWMNM